MKVTKICNDMLKNKIYCYWLMNFNILIKFSVIDLLIFNDKHKFLFKNLGFNDFKVWCYLDLNFKQYNLEKQKFQTVVYDPLDF